MDATLFRTLLNIWMDADIRHRWSDNDERVLSDALEHEARTYGYECAAEAYHQFKLPETT